MVCVFYHHNKKFYYKLRERETETETEKEGTQEGLQEKSFG